MENKSKTQQFAAYASFLLCSQIFLNPLYKTTHKLFAAVLTAFFGVIINALSYRVFTKLDKVADNEYSIGFLTRAFGIIGALLLCAAASFYVGELTSAVGRFSQFYESKSVNILFAAALIAVSAFAGYKSTGGIMRLCSVCLISFIAYFFALFFGITSLKGVVAPYSPQLDGISSESLKESLLSALYFFADVPIFFFALFYEEKNGKGKSVKNKKSYLYAIVFSLTVLFASCIRTVLYFGNELSAALYSCDLASLKLIRGFGFNELYIFFTGFACVIKLSVYLFAASVMINPRQLCKGCKSGAVYALSAPAATFIFYLLRKSLFPKVDLLCFFVITILLSGIFSLIFPFISSKLKKSPFSTR